MVIRVRSEWQLKNEHSHQDERLSEKRQYREAGEYIPVQLTVPDLRDEVGEEDAATGV